MSLLCEDGDRSIIENQTKYMEYLATMRKRNDKSLYKKDTLKNINLNEVEKLLNVYITNHKKKLTFILLTVNSK